MRLEKRLEQKGKAEMRRGERTVLQRRKEKRNDLSSCGEGR